MSNLEYYNSPEELFDDGNARETLVDGYLEVLLDDESINDKAKIQLQQIIDSEQLQDKLIDEIKNKLNASNILNNYVYEYTIAELSDMDNPWNIVMDITNNYILNHINSDSHNLYEEFRVYENLWD